MATIKSYTDISQSKKLAEILPPESADMFYDGYKNVLDNEDINYQIDVVSNWTTAYPNKSLFEKSDDTTIPCWSLAALLANLPDYTLQTNSDGTVFVVSDSKKPMISDAYDNPVDACYEMIIKLHELKML